MKKWTLLILMMLLAIVSMQSKNISLNIINKTEQAISQLDYWIGPSEESWQPNKATYSKGALAKDASSFIMIDYHLKKRNTIWVKAILVGGGYINQKYSLSKKERAPEIILYNFAEKISPVAMQKVVQKFNQLNLDDGYIKMSKQNGIEALVGSMIVYNKNEEIIARIDPGVLQTQVSNVPMPDLQQTISGIFSANMTMSAGVSLPFVEGSNAFEYGDVAKFVWEVEDVGQYTWASENGKSLAELFLALPQESKDALVQLYKDYPDAKMKFIDQAFVIGRLEVTTLKSKKISSGTEISSLSFATAKGNFAFEKGMEDHFVVRDVITEVKGYDATNLLKLLCVQEESGKGAMDDFFEEEELRTVSVFTEEKLVINPNQLLIIEIGLPDD